MSQSTIILFDPSPPAGVHSPWRRAMGSGRVRIGGGILLLMALACTATLPWTLSSNSGFFYHGMGSRMVRQGPSLDAPAGLFGADKLGRSVLGRCLLGGTVSLGVGLAAACISVVLGLGVGLLAGYRGGWIDGLLMRMERV